MSEHENDDQETQELYSFTATTGFYAGGSDGFQTTNSDLGSSSLLFKRADEDGDFEIVPDGSFDETTLVSLDGGETWTSFKTIAIGEFEMTPSQYNSAISPFQGEESVNAVVIEVDGQQYAFFPDYPDATGPLPGLIKLGEGGDPIFLCFAAGTRIMTPSGEVPVEDLEAGDLVLTRDNGAQPLRWIGRATVPASEKMAPVIIRAGAFGEGQPRRDLRVSPHHRLLVTGAALELTLGMNEALVPARHLVNDRTVVRDRSAGHVTYFHLLFERHEIVTSEGLATESFHPGQWGMSVIDEAARAELLELFPQLAVDADGFGPAARTVLRRHEASVLAAQ